MVSPSENRLIIYRAAAVNGIGILLTATGLVYLAKTPDCDRADETCIIERTAMSAMAAFGGVIAFTSGIALTYSCVIYCGEKITMLFKVTQNNS